MRNNPNANGPNNQNGTDLPASVSEYTGAPRFPLTERKKVGALFKDGMEDMPLIRSGSAAWTAGEKRSGTVFIYGIACTYNAEGTETHINFFITPRPTLSETTIQSANQSGYIFADVTVARCPRTWGDALRQGFGDVVVAQLKAVRDKQVADARVSNEKERLRRVEQFKRDGVAQREREAREARARAEAEAAEHERKRLWVEQNRRKYAINAAPSKEEVYQLVIAKLAQNSSANYDIVRLENGSSVSTYANTLLGEIKILEAKPEISDLKCVAVEHKQRCSWTEQMVYQDYVLGQEFGSDRRTAPRKEQASFLWTDSGLSAPDYAGQELYIPKRNTTSSSGDGDAKERERQRRAERDERNEEFQRQSNERFEKTQQAERCRLSNGMSC